MTWHLKDTWSLYSESKNKINFRFALLQRDCFILCKNFEFYKFVGNLNKMTQLFSQIEINLPGFNLKETFFTFVFYKILQLSYIDKIKWNIYVNDVQNILLIVRDIIKEKHLNTLRHYKWKITYQIKKITSPINWEKCCVKYWMTLIEIWPKKIKTF